MVDRSNSGAVLLSYVERIERLEDQKKEISQDIRDVYLEAKQADFDTKVLRAVIARRRRDAEEVAAFEDKLESYLHALGALADTPLGQAAVRKVLA